MITTTEYRTKFLKSIEGTPYYSLPQSEQLFIATKASKFFFTFQEIKKIIEIALDLQMWNEGPLLKFWPSNFEVETNTPAKDLKKQFINTVIDKWNELKLQEKDYSNFQSYVDQQPIIIVQRKEKKIGLGRCPVASPKTRCCNLYTLDSSKNCGLDCSYCCIQSFFHNNQVYFDPDFAQKLKKLNLNPNQTYHIGTGQSSDSLMWGNKHGILDDLTSFAKKNSNVILELKSKSNNIDYFLKNQIPSNLICTWTLNTDTIIKNEEHLTSSLDERLLAARKIADKKNLVGFHFHPMIYYKGWEEEYSDLFKKIQKLFLPSEIAMISLGTATFIKPVLKKIRERQIKSKILQMPLIETNGKYSYPFETKLRMFKFAYQQFQKWHMKTFFYLCMEDEKLWNLVFGHEYQNNQEFESDMLKEYLKKINFLKKNHQR